MLRQQNLLFRLAFVARARAACLGLACVAPALSWWMPRKFGDDAADAAARSGAPRPKSILRILRSLPASPARIDQLVSRSHRTGAESSPIAAGAESPRGRDLIGFNQVIDLLFISLD